MIGWTTPLCTRPHNDSPRTDTLPTVNPPPPLRNSRKAVTLAAQDLCITQSAVSRQIRSLERMLGTRLFTRGHRSITFTPAAERLFRSADSAVQQLQDAVGVIGVSSTRHARSPQSTTAVTSLRLAARTSIRLGHSSGTRVIFATRITIPQNSRS
jgi:hypothetical protein